MGSKILLAAIAAGKVFHLVEQLLKAGKTGAAKTALSKAKGADKSKGQVLMDKHQMKKDAPGSFTTKEKVKMDKTDSLKAADKKAARKEAERRAKKGPQPKAKEAREDMMAGVGKHPAGQATLRGERRAEHVTKHGDDSAKVFQVPQTAKKSALHSPSKIAKARQEKARRDRMKKAEEEGDE